MFWGIYRVLWVPNIGDRARTSTNLLLRMKLRWSERPNLGLPPERYGWSPREKIRATEDQARGARIRQEMLLAEERVKRLEDHLKRSIDESKDRILRMKLRLEEEAWRRYEQTLPTPTEDNSERRAPEDDYRTGANYVDYSQTPAYTPVPKSVYESSSPRLRSSTNWVDYSQMPTAPERPRSYYSGGHEEDLLKIKVRASTPMRDYERPRSYYSGGHEEDLLKRKVRASTPMRDYERPRSYYSGGREEDLFDRETRASTPIRDYEDGLHTGFRHEPPPERPRMTVDKAVTKLAEALAGILDSRKLSHVGHDDNLRRYVVRQSIDDKETDSCPATMSENGEAEVGDTSAKESMEVYDLSESGGSKQTDNEQAAQNGEDPPVRRNAEPDAQATVITGEPMDASLESSETSVRNESLVDNADTDTDTDVHEDEDSGNDEEWYNAESDDDLEEVTEERTIDETDESEGPSSKEAKLKHTAEKRKNPDRALSEPAASASKKDKAGSKKKGGASVRSTLTGFISRTSSAPRLRSTWSSNDTDSLQGFNELESPTVTEGRAGPAFPLVASNGSYEIGLLWKGTARPDSNESQAYALAKSQMARLDRDGTRDAYDKVLLQEYSELDAIEREPKPDTEGYYLPHHAVIRQKSSTTKVRVVFNASASKSGKQSLNDVVDPGPSLIPQLTSLLIRFRELPAAVQSDIRKAFFMIGVREDDRRYLRFLWPDEDGVMTVWRLKKLPFGVNCSPFILSAVIDHHLQAQVKNCTQEELQLLILLRESFKGEHEDDCVSSLNVDEEMETFCELRKVRLDTLCPGNDKPLRGPTVLVVTWDPTSDALSVCLRAGDVKGYAARTRSLLLRMAEAHFDTGRVLMQLAGRETTECDKTFSSSRSLSARVSAWWGETNKVELQARCMTTKQLVQQYFIPFVVLYIWRLWMKMKDARMKNSSLLDSESSLFNTSLHLPVKQQSLPIP